MHDDQLGQLGMVFEFGLEPVELARLEVAADLVGNDVQGAFDDGIDRFTKDYEDRLMEIQDFVWNMFPYSLEMLGYHEAIEKPVTLISGHIISRRLSGRDDVYVHDFENGYVWYNIDCGCAMGDGLGRLSCLKINEDGEIEEIFYVE